MLKENVKTLITDIKGCLTQAMTYVISYVTMQAMRFSMQTVMKLLIVMFLPKLSSLISIV